MELWERLCERDEEVYDEIINKYAGFVWSICGGIMKNAGTNEDIEECVADVFIELWRYPGRFDPKRGKFEAYLAVLSRSRAVNACKRIKPSVPICEDMASSAGTAEDAVIARELGDRINTAAGQLGKSGREIFYRRYYLGQKPREIAVSMSISPREVRNRLYRSKKEFKELIGGDLCEI